jgi:hypothetical protein
MRRWTTCVAVAFLAVSQPAEARTVAPELFCEAVPDAAMCWEAGAAPCAVCHTQQPALDPYGEDVRGALLEIANATDVAAFQEHLADALAAVATIDSDGDGVTNEEEISLGSYPGDPASQPGAAECPDEPIGWLHVCSYDARFAFLRVWQDFCGTRPDSDSLAIFDAADDESRRALVHEALDDCLATEFWMGRDGQVWKLAHRKVRPIVEIRGFAEFDYDYGLFAYAHLDHHDVRDVLTASYIVEPSPAGTVPTTYTRFDGPLPSQPLEPARRAGMLTSAWSLLYNTMFTAIPRNAAAQAYRAHLDLDIAQLEGLEASAPVPVDYDGAGIAAPACATCHSTLDPLSYPFTRYNGLQDPLYAYDPGRMVEFATALGKPELASVPEAGRVLGQDVENLLEWASVAASSDDYFRAVAADYWKLLVGAEPSPDQGAIYADYEVVWSSLAADPEHSVFTMLHGLVDTEAYGAP